ncbi:MAG TPA: coproporphyrinogen dehydrogenase HemZ [Eubacterium sp.]|jgi:coproporphyrinogen dehydrogenase HemZ|nr:coproporphyrinogen dehydrogenase HemZ [Eubacterium sp.]
MILLEFNDAEQENDSRVMLKAFFPEAKIVTSIPENADEAPELFVQVRVIRQEMAGLDNADCDRLIRIYFHRDSTDRWDEYEDEAQQMASGKKEARNVFKRMMYDMLKKLTGRELPWGTLTGVRPTKIVYTLLEDGKNDHEIRDYLKKEYYVSEKKGDLAIKVASNEKRLLEKLDYNNGYSLYAGIPFCPTTCLYCSFTSYPLAVWKDRVDTYVDAMLKELEFTSRLMKDKKLDTFYMGGGTPTTLEPEQLDRVLSFFEEHFDTTGLKEYTIEAGRPDSITRDKLLIMKKHGVDRISINPQTMNDDTLKLIGRHHTVEQIKEAFTLARECGFDNINMDLIIGLPGETREHIERTMREVALLAPDSLTVHSLAIKRAARLNIFWEKYKDYAMVNTDDIINMTADCAAAMGMEPYYLYRQKNMAGNFENVGYSKPGREGIYNILIMEEKQTIMAVGAGASTKVVFPEENRIERVENVKDVTTYIENIDEMIDRKRRFFYG